ncbi:hypothetical protein [Streptomyces anulatus]|uniref:hypothetical protein n=1 Tax=Streptomyces anulatus TaxID=1892 RepID=UPI0033F3527F
MVDTGTGTAVEGAGPAEMTPQEQEAFIARMRGTLSGARKQSSLVRAFDAQAAGPMKGNLTLGVALHATARLSQGMTPTALEEMLLAPLRGCMSGTMLALLGEWFHSTRECGEAMPLLPEVITSRATATAYDWADLEQHAPAMLKVELAKPNVAVLDREKVAASGVFDSAEFVAGMEASRSGATAFVRPHGDDAEAVHAAAEDGPEFRAKLRAWSFNVERTVDDQGGGRDEIYWATSCGSDVEAGQPWTSQKFGAVVKRDEPYWFDKGNLMLANLKMRRYMALTVQAWEADQSSDAWYKALLGRLQYFADYVFANPAYQIGSQLPGGSMAGWIADINSLAVILMENLRNEDDLSAHRAFVFDRYDLSLIKEHGGMGWSFNGDGHHILTVRYEGDEIPFPVGSLAYRVRGDDEDAWSAEIGLPWQSITPPALAVHMGVLHAAFVRPDKAVMVTWRGPAGAWSAPVQFWNARSNVAPSLASHGGRLWCAIAAPGGEVRVYSKKGIGNWTPSDVNTTIATSHSPTLFAFQLPDGEPHLWLAYSSFADKTLHMQGYDAEADRWYSPGKQSWDLDQPVSMAVAHASDDGQPIVVRAALGLDERTHSAYTRSTSSPWFDDDRALPPIPGTLTHSPTLLQGPTGGTPTLSAFMRGSDGNLWHTTLRNTKWSDPSRVPDASTPVPLMDQPAAARHDGKTYLLYRR